MKTLELRTGFGLAGLDGVARDDGGRVVFVEGAAPDEVVRVELLSEKKRHARARVLEILEPSPHRVEPRCPHHHECGGCGLQQVDAEAQSAAKASAVREVLTRIGRVVPRTWSATWAGPAYGVRSRVRWRASEQGVGLLRRKSHQLVDLEVCPILEPPLENALVELRTLWKRDRLGADEIDGLTDGRQVWLHRRSGRPGPEMQTAQWVERGDSVQIPDAWGARTAAVGAFGQNHRAGNDAMLHQLRDWVRPVSSALELYAGAGNWTRILAEQSETTVAVERDADAATSLGQAVDGVEVWTADAAEGLARFMRRRPEGWGLLVNPPRTGFDPELWKHLSTEGLAWLIYVSCDPATFARDAARLTELGLSLDEARVFDLYPHTAHVELMARFLPAA